MSAENARQMTANALSPDTELIQEFLRHVEVKVRCAAAQGKRQISHPLSDLSVRHPLSGLSVHYPDSTVRDAVRKALEANGYTWTHHPDPDPGHPGSGEYETVSW